LAIRRGRNGPVERAAASDQYDRDQHRNAATEQFRSAGIHRCVPSVIGQIVQRPAMRRQQRCGPLLHGIPTPFEARRARFLIRLLAGLLFLARLLLLLLCLRRVLTPALAASRARARRSARTSVTHSSSDDRAACGTAHACAGRSSGRGRRRIHGRSGRRWLGGVVLALLYGPRVALCLVLLLLPG